MEVITKSIIITQKVLNESTGELETKSFKEEKSSKTIRGGFNLMYHKSYEEITETVITSKKDMQLFNWITNRFTYARIESTVLYSECPINVAQSKFATFVKKLVTVEYLKRVSRGIYRLNPYVYVPFRANGELLQKEWNELG